MADFNPTRAGFGFEKPNAGQSNDWISPAKLIERLGQFDLDPCESDSQPWPCAARGYRLGRGEDGLKLPWEGRVWSNPPYGNNILAWAEKMAAHRNGIFLIFSRIETQAWSKIWRTGDAFLFPDSRVRFCLPDGTRAKSGTAPSALIAYGENNVEALRGCGIAGTFIRQVEILEGVKASSL